MGRPEKVKEKPKNIKKTLNSLFSYYKKYIPFLIIALLCSIGSTIFSLISPYKISELIDVITVGLTASMDIDAIKNLCIVLFFGEF